MSTLFLMLGYPGAGKTTTAKIISKLITAKYLSSDELREKMFPESTFSQEEHNQLYETLDSQLEEAMKHGNNVIYDANLNRLVHRKEKYALAKKYSYKTVLVWVQTPKHVAKQRRIEDSSHHHLVPAHVTPAEMFEHSTRVFEPPATNEPYIKIDGTKVTDDYIKNALDL